MMDWLGMIPKPRRPRPELRDAVLRRALEPRVRITWGAGALAAAAVLAVLLVGGGWWARTTIVALRDTLSFVRDSTTRVVWVPIVTKGQAGAVTIFVDSATGRWLMRCEGMAANEPEQTYQIWFITERGPKPAGLMTMTHTTVMTMGIEVPPPGDLGARVVGVAMSIEPRRGSAQPEGPMVFQVRL